MRPTANETGAAEEQSVGLFAAEDAPAAAHSMNFDPRQGTLEGFELPAEALASLREPEEAPLESPPASPEPSEVAQDDPARLRPADIRKGVAMAADEAAGNTPSALNAAPARRQAAASRKSAQPTVDAGSAAADVADAALQRSHDALAQSLATLQAALVDERRAAHERRRRTTRLVVAAMAVSLLVLVLGVVQTVVALRTADASTAAEQKTEALLRAQQTELAAFIDAASSASADIRDAADTLDAKLAAQPGRPPAAAIPAAKHTPRPVHPRKAAERARASNAY